MDGRERETGSAKHERETSREHTKKVADANRQIPPQKSVRTAAEEGSGNLSAKRDKKNKKMNKITKKPAFYKKAIERTLKRDAAEAKVEVGFKAEAIKCSLSPSQANSARQSGRDLTTESQSRKAH